MGEPSPTGSTAVIERTLQRIREMVAIVVFDKYVGKTPDTLGTESLSDGITQKDIFTRATHLWKTTYRPHRFDTCGQIRRG
jgi:hypothetical protein